MAMRGLGLWGLLGTLALIVSVCGHIVPADQPDQPCRTTLRTYTGWAEMSPLSNSSAITKDGTTN